MLEFTCPTCGKRVQGDASAGQAVKCPSCNMVTIAPGSSPVVPQHAPKFSLAPVTSDATFRDGEPPLPLPPSAFRRDFFA